MSSSTRTPPGSPFPFDHVVITFPDAAAAAAADTGPLRRLREAYHCHDSRADGGADRRSARAAVRFTAAADPHGARVGSGGGTAAALVDRTATASAAATDAASATAETVLILHAGGAASRCPTQMCLGKAWTSLPTSAAVNTARDHSGGGSGGSGSGSGPGLGGLQTPLHLWLRLCAQLFAGLPAGSLVVIAADTLLQLEMEGKPSHDGDDDDGADATTRGIAASGGSGGIIDWTATEVDAASTAHMVLGLAVPAALTTAKNHGVFVVASGRSHANDDSAASATVGAAAQILPCHRVLQKPTVDALLQEGGCFALPCSGGGGDPEENLFYAWIDTGVTIFTPLAAAAFRAAAVQHLPRCTAQGLQALHAAMPPPQAGADGCSLPQFAAQQALSVDLYTHVLQALSLAPPADGTVAADRRQAYLDRYATALPREVAAGLWDTLSPCTLRVLAVPTGRFWHLGTTRELLDFVVDGASRGGNGGDATPRQTQCHDYGRSLGMTRRLHAYTTLGGTYDGSHSRGSCVSHSAVIYHSILIAGARQNDNNNNPTEQKRHRDDETSWIGAGTVIEHCHVEAKKATIYIGNGCLVSGLRSPPTVGDNRAAPIYIPDSLMVQMVRLSDNGVSTTPSGEPLYAVVVLGIDDDVKRRETLYGRPMDAVLSWLGVSDRDVWNESERSQTLWTAQLHPVISLDRGESFSTVFAWLRGVLTAGADGAYAPGGAADDASAAAWRQCRRLSLAEVRDQSDAPREFAYRDALAALVPTRRAGCDRATTAMLLGRHRDAPLDFQCLVDDYSANAAVMGGCRDIVDTLHGLDEVVRTFMNQIGSQDISARACMLVSGLLDDAALALAKSQILSADRRDCAALESSILALLSDVESVPGGAADMTKLLNAFDFVVSIRDESVGAYSTELISLLSKIMVEFAGIMTGKHVLGARGMADALRAQPPVYDKWILATAPARIDLSGGWSDTPPICYEFGSLVTGMAVSIDGRKPLACKCRIVSGGTGVLLRTESRDSQNGALISAIDVEMSSLLELQNYRDPTSDCALLKCALIHLGLLGTSVGSADDNFQSTVNAFCQSEADVRLELVATALLPQGSGLGTSSILAGIILATVAKCVGAGRQSQMHYNEDLIDSVLNVEQYLTAGGGFQDQANGLIGGIKTVASTANTHPMRISVEQLEVSHDFRRELNKSLVLVFTGKTRLAKNLLKQVLQRWSKQTPEIFDTVSDLVNGAESCRNAVTSGDLDALGECLSRYWAQKKVMAGPSSGVEPEVVRDVIAELQKRCLIRGGSLCGAGGGGFMVLLCADGISSADLRSAVNSFAHTRTINDLSAFTFHDCELSDEGLVLRQLDEVVTVEDFDISWITVDKLIE